MLHVLKVGAGRGRQRVRLGDGEGDRGIAAVDPPPSPTNHPGRDRTRHCFRDRSEALGTRRRSRTHCRLLAKEPRYRRRPRCRTCVTWALTVNGCGAVIDRLTTVSHPVESAIVT